jgi:hypothetical protein
VLLWKNHLLRKRNPVTFLVEILVPVIFTFILVAIAGTLKVSHPYTTGGRGLSTTTERTRRITAFGHVVEKGCRQGGQAESYPRCEPPCGPQEKVIPAYVPSSALDTTYDAYVQNYGQPVCLGNPRGDPLLDATIFWRCAEGPGRHPWKASP